MPDPLAAIAAARAAGDDAALADAVARAPEAGRDASGMLSEVLAETGSPRVRNAAAMALADMRAPGSAERIAAVLERPGLARASGTLLYALSRMEGKLPLGTLVRIVREGSFEARAEAIDFLRRGSLHPFTPGEVCAAATLLAGAAREPTEAGEHAGMALEAVGALANVPNLPAADDPDPAPDPDPAAPAA